jgi:hypothetical protein
MKEILRRCASCNQPLDEEHLSVYDCLQTLVKRVEALEDELLAKRLPDALSRSSEPGPPSSNPLPIIIPKLDKK